MTTAFHMSGKMCNPKNKSVWWALMIGQTYTTGGRDSGMHVFRCRCLGTEHVDRGREGHTTARACNGATQLDSPMPEGSVWGQVSTLAQAHC